MIGVGAMLNKRFTLVKELGQGGMGTVYRATDQLLGRNVAIKLLKDYCTAEAAQKTRLEAQILARLVHDNIVRLYDFGESDGTFFLVMEEVNGPSFANRWRDLPLVDRLRICEQVAEALDYAHVQGVIPREVKPGNVLLTPGDQAKLSDFGISLVTGDRSDRSGTIRGTPLYMSPEQAQGKSLDHRTDLNSVRLEPGGRATSAGGDLRPRVLAKRTMFTRTCGQPLTLIRSRAKRSPSPRACGTASSSGR